MGSQQDTRTHTIIPFCRETELTKFRENLLMQFSVISFVVLAAVAVSISTILVARLNRDVDLLKDHRAAVVSGRTVADTDPYSIPNLVRDVKDLRWITYGVVGTGFLLLYGGLVLIVWRNWSTIVQQRIQLQALNSQLEAAGEQTKVTLAERTEALQVANQELEAFSYSVSHDLRAPLRGIDGFSQALLEDHGDQLNEEGQDYLRRVRAASQRMGHLIDDLLQLSRISRSEMKEQRVDLSAVAREITADLHRTEPDRKAKMVIEDGLSVIGDSGVLRLVLENLLGNAWKFTSHHSSATIEFGVTQEDGGEAYFVRDDGAGFDMAYADKLFGPFQRLHQAIEFPGNGIGLATVQRIINRHGGRVWAEGQVEKGVTFYFTL